MPGHNHPRRPARRGAHRHWGDYRSLQDLHIKEGRQAVMMRRQGCQLFRSHTEVSAYIYYGARSYF